MECPAYTIYNWRTPGCTVVDALKTIAEKEDLKTLAFEGDVMNYRQYFEMPGKSFRAGAWLPADGVIEKIRSDEDSGRDRLPAHILPDRLQSI